MLLVAFMALAASPPDGHVRDDGYRLMDGHFVGRVGCDHRGDVPIGQQPSGMLSLAECKRRCDSLGGNISQLVDPSCRGFSFQRGGLHTHPGARSNCLLKRNCSGRVVPASVSVCSPEETPVLMKDGSPSCITRKVDTFNYMRIIPVERSQFEDYDDEASVRAPQSPAGAAQQWATAFARLQPTSSRVGMLYLNLGTWPPWTRFILHAAAANADIVFYFLGAPLATSLYCPNCFNLPLDLESLRSRVRLHVLNASAVDQFGAQGTAARKLCDLVPMWPALFPELSTRHRFLGITEHDMLPGNLSAEVARLHELDDLMIPLERYPQPLTDANFMIFRTVPKMLQAFRRVPGWQQVVLSNKHARFDEWVVEPPSIMVAFQQMLLASDIRVLPAQHFLVQDVVIIRKAGFPRIDDYGARVSLQWSQGRLFLKRDGPCICASDVVPTFGVTWCLECFHNPGVVLHTRTSRHLEILGFHFSAWKKRWTLRDRRKVIPLKWWFVPSRTTNLRGIAGGTEMVHAELLKALTAKRASGLPLEFTGDEWRNLQVKGELRYDNYLLSNGGHFQPRSKKRRIKFVPTDVAVPECVPGEDFNLTNAGFRCHSSRTAKRGQRTRK